MTIKLLFLIPLTYIAFVLETSGGTWPLPGSTMPQFMFLAAALAVLWCPGSTAIMWAVASGLLADVVGGGPLGLNVVLLANLAFISQMAGARQSSESVFTSAAFVLLFVTFAGFASQTLQHVLAGGGARHSVDRTLVRQSRRWHRRIIPGGDDLLGNDDTRSPTRAAVQSESVWSTKLGTVSREDITQFQDLES